MDSTLARARTLFLDGVQHYGAGRLHEAERDFAAALALAPGRPSVLTNLGAVRLKLGRPHEAVALLREAIAQEPDNTEALGHCATAHAELGEAAAALDLFDRALARNPALASLWTLRGSVLKELGRPADAAASFRTALDRGGEPALNHWYLAGLRQEAAPPTAPAQYVEALFDGYAEQFDRHVQQDLRYDAPRVLAQRLVDGGGRWEHALDLGCGTGLCGPHLRRVARRLTGVDLSANMLDRAQALGAYDTLVHAELAAFLAAAQERFDLVVAADVFIYVGALDAVFREVARVMPPRGTFCFSVEEGSDDLELRASLRYAHSEAGLRRLAGAHGFAVEALERRPVRHDQRQPIPGLFCWLRRS